MKYSKRSQTIENEISPLAVSSCVIAPLQITVSWQKKQRIRLWQKYCSNYINLRLLLWTICPVTSWAWRIEVWGWYSPSLRGVVVSLCLFSLSCWKALLGSNLRRGAPGSFDFSCSRSLFCRLTWERSLVTSYTHSQEKRGWITSSFVWDKAVQGLKLLLSCFTCFSEMFSSFSFITCLIFCFWFWWPSRRA